MRYFFFSISYEYINWDSERMIGHENFGFEQSNFPSMEYLKHFAKVHTSTNHEMLSICVTALTEFSKEDYDKLWIERYVK